MHIHTAFVHGIPQNPCNDFLFPVIPVILAARIMLGEKLLLVIKSTVPPGTVENRVLPYLEAQGWKNGVDFSLANNPEFLREGHCWEDFIHADRVVIGCSDDWSEQKLRMLYEKLGAPVCAVSCSTAEFIKYLSNSLLATMISYANEMSEVAERIGKIDTAEAFHILHMDRRWAGAEMASYVYPGCGYGGYCLPKDTKALYALANSIGLQLPLYAGKQAFRGKGHQNSSLGGDGSAGDDLGGAFSLRRRRKGILPSAVQHSIIVSLQLGPGVFLPDILPVGTFDLLSPDCVKGDQGILRVALLQAGDGIFKIVQIIIAEP